MVKPSKKAEEAASRKYCETCNEVIAPFDHQVYRDGKDFHLSCDPHRRISSFPCGITNRLTELLRDHRVDARIRP